MVCVLHWPLNLWSLGGMMSLLVKSKTEDSVKCEVVDGGELKSRRHLNVRGKSATLPSITGWTWNYHLCHSYLKIIMLSLTPNPPFLSKLVKWYYILQMDIIVCIGFCRERLGRYKIWSGQQSWLLCCFLCQRCTSSSWIEELSEK